MRPTKIPGTHATRFTIPPDPAHDFILLDWRGGQPCITNDALLGTERDAAQRIRGRCEERDLCLIGVYRNFMGRREYFADFGHFTGAGSTAVAALIVRQLTVGLVRLGPVGPGGAGGPVRCDRSVWRG